MRCLRIVVLTTIFSIPSITASAADKPKPTQLPICSYAITNGNCQIVIDRLNPVIPPTIYVYPRSHVEVSISHPYPYERVTLDWKSATTVVPPDTFSAAFAALSPTAEKILTVGTGAGAKSRFACEDTPDGCTTPGDISNAQRELAGNLDGSSVDVLAKIRPQLEQIKKGLLPPPGGSDNPGLPWADETVTVEEKSVTIKVDDWKKNVLAAIDTVLTQTPDLALWRRRSAALSESITALQKTAKTIGDKADLDVLTANEKLIDTKIGAVSDAIDKVKALRDGFDKIDPNGKGIEGNVIIQDPNPDDKNYQIQTWTLDYSNKLAPLAKRFSADALKTESAAYASSLNDASDKQPILAFTVQFQAPTHFELTTGVMVPTKGFHSYTVNNSIVQEKVSFAIVPMAFINYRLVQWPTKGQPSAFFITGGVGVNSLTTNVDLGFGATYSYRSMAFSFLADVGRDTELTNGMSVGQTTTATSATTGTYWSVKPAFALSVRIPLGSSASPAAGSGSASK